MPCILFEKTKEIYESRNVWHVVRTRNGIPLCHRDPTYAFTYAHLLLRPFWATIETQIVHIIRFCFCSTSTLHNLLIRVASKIPKTLVLVPKHCFWKQARAKNYCTWSLKDDAKISCSLFVFGLKRRKYFIFDQLFVAT